MADTAIPQDEQGDQALFSQFVATLKENMDSSDSNTVLVVDDAKLMRDLVSEFIVQAAPLVKVVTSEDGKDALGKLAWIRETTGRDPMLIITDLDMPVMDGWSFVEELRKEYRAKGADQGIPVIVLSSTDGEKRTLFRRKTVATTQRQYQPLVAVAKSTCIDPANYDAIGNKGLAAWIEYFLEKA
ncbi:MAG: response regulator [Lentisphaerae bacterium]|jgi:two-component system, chemotaxis family, chemotaxis protein CheY|nr:response regulator [Lentisphaerota bacterium]MBT4819949.1 response regulator [Lentisphaerota bacterium]MBT5605595.1 response regulator [Lentisphaerota bacterium]MBT7054006.1 response regulator [Lentisphaerota bacterium]MBT7842311.1 response regulator [Lentisphaerota bacterium]